MKMIIETKVNAKLAGRNRRGFCVSRFFTRIMGHRWHSYVKQFLFRQRTIVVSIRFGCNGHCVSFAFDFFSWTPAILRISEGKWTRNGRPLFRNKRTVEHGCGQSSHCFCRDSLLSVVCIFNILTDVFYKDIRFVWKRSEVFSKKNFEKIKIFHIKVWNYTKKLCKL